MSEDDDDHVCRVFVCPDCEAEYYLERGCYFDCLKCNRRLFDTGLSVIVDKHGTVFAVN